MSRVIAMIPARMGSQRLEKKNLQLLNGIPLINHSINNAIDSGMFDDIFVNTESKELFEEAQVPEGVYHYWRSESLATSETRSDDVVYDFTYGCCERGLYDYVVWVNSISPFTDGDTIANFVDSLIHSDYNSMFTVLENQVHTVYDGDPVNYDESGKFALTQDLNPTYTFTYSLMGWKIIPMEDQYEKTNECFFVPKVGYYSVPKINSIIVKTKEDLELCERIMKK